MSIKRITARTLSGIPNLQWTKINNIQQTKGKLEYLHKVHPHLTSLQQTWGGGNAIKDDEKNSISPSYKTRCPFLPQLILAGSLLFQGKWKGSIILLQIISYNQSNKFTLLTPLTKKRTQTLDSQFLTLLFRLLPPKVIAIDSHSICYLIKTVGKCLKWRQNDVFPLTSHRNSRILVSKSGVCNISFFEVCKNKEWKHLKLLNLENTTKKEAKQKQRRATIYLNTTTIISRSNSRLRQIDYPIDCFPDQKKIKIKLLGSWEPPFTFIKRY